MIEGNNSFHAVKVFARSVKWSDVFKLVVYSDYLGNISRIPFFFKKSVGHTTSIDLSRDINTIFLGMKSNTRNEIRKAEREEFKAYFDCSPEDFVRYYNVFANEKGLSFISNYNLTKYHNIILAATKSGDDILSMHATIVDKDEKIAALLYSCSIRLNENIDSKKVGWSNRYLHYKEFEYLKSLGIKKYEWSGVSIDPEDKARYNIGQFKLSFGGDGVRECYHLYTPLFVLANTLMSLIKTFNRKGK